MSISRSLGRILFLAPSLKGATEIWLHRILAGLGDQVVAIGSEDSPETINTNIPFYPLNPIIKWRVKHLLSAVGGYDRFLRYTINRNIKTIKRQHVLEQFNTILCNYAHYGVRHFEALHLPNAKWFVYCHGHDIAWDGFSMQPPHTPLHSSQYLESLRKVAQSGAIFIANSLYTKGKLLEMSLPESSIRLAYYGIDPSEYGTVRTFADRLKLNILYVGRLIDFKGPDIVLRAFIEARKRGLNATITIIGDGELRLACELIARSSPYGDDIEFKGTLPRDVVTQYYKKADIFCLHNQCGPFTNREEAFGAVMLEAMAAGLPVVTGRSGGVIESIIDGETGLLVSPGDVGAHADALIRLQDPTLRERMSRAAREHIDRNFSLAVKSVDLQNVLNGEN